MADGFLARGPRNVGRESVRRHSRRHRALPHLRPLRHGGYWTLSRRSLHRPGCEGQGAGRALIEGVVERTRAHGTTKLRWISAPGNAIARRLYDSVASVRWMVYDLDP
ncbi:GNAT family N-acetyltransferase [Humibacter ginsengisoli]